MGKLIDLTGKVFGRLTVVEKTEKRTGSGSVVWRCKCECGKGHSTASSSLLSGGVRSCGCLLSESSAKRSTTHGQSKTKIYKAWQHMVERCSNPNLPCYNRYGGRGITVCDRWRKFENFFEDMAPRPEGLTLERVNNEQGYYPGNCEWIPPADQYKNMRPVSCGTGKQFWFRAWHKNSMVQWMSNNQRKFAKKYDLRAKCISLCLSGKSRQHKGWYFRRIDVRTA